MDIHQNPYDHRKPMFVELGGANIPLFCKNKLGAVLFMLYPTALSIPKGRIKKMHERARV